MEYQRAGISYQLCQQKRRKSGSELSRACFFGEKLRRLGHEQQRKRKKLRRENLRGENLERETKRQLISGSKSDRMADAAKGSCYCQMQLSADAAESRSV